jgi:hypothetical protein
MKEAGRSLATILLLFVLTTNAFAGHMDTPPAPAKGYAQMDTTTIMPAKSEGQIGIPPAFNAGETTTIDTLTEFALDIWQFMPLLF